MNIWSKLSTDCAHDTIVLIMSKDRIDEYFVMAGYPERLKQPLLIGTVGPTWMMEKIAKSMELYIATYLA